MKRVWKAKIACMMPWKDFRQGETCELDDNQVDERVKSLFVCLTVDDVKKEEDRRAEMNDPSFRVKVQRLKQANVTIPKGANKEQIDRLFEENLGNSSDLPTASR